MTTHEQPGSPPEAEIADKGADVLESVGRGRSLGAAITLRLRRRDIQRMVVNVIVIFLLGILVQARTGVFFTVKNLEGLAGETEVISVIAFAMTFVMVAGQIDISVGGIVVLSGIVDGLLIQHGMPIWAATICATISGVLVGLLNSGLVRGIGITAMIATIGTLYVTEGVAQIITNGVPVSSLPLSFGSLGNGFIGTIPISAVVIFASLAVMVAIQRWTILGRNAVASGSNAQGAYLNGVKVTRTITYCFMLSGAAAGFGGCLYASRVGVPVPALDNNLLFQVIVACVIGGTSLFGGEGTVFGTFIGSVLIGVVNNSLDLLGISTFWQSVALGVLLVLAVGMDMILRRDSFSRLRRKVLGKTRVRARIGAS